MNTPRNREKKGSHSGGLMRTISIATLVLTLGATPLSAAEPFRWGAGETFLRNQENSRIYDESVPAEGTRALFLNDRMAGLDAFVIYLLKDDRLVRTRYLFAQNHTDFNRFLPEYARVEEILRSRHGQPVRSEKIWLEERSHEESDLGRMIAAGQVVVSSRWETGDTVIVHLLRGRDLDVDHEINYFDRKAGQAAGEFMEEIRPPQWTRF